MAILQEKPKLSPSDELQFLYEEYSEVVIQAAYRVTRNKNDAEDVLQTIFLRVMNLKLPKQDDRDYTAYFKRAAVNASLDLLRKRKTKQVMIEEIDCPSKDDPPDKELHQKEMIGHLSEAIRKLHPSLAEVFTLNNFENLSHEKIAELKGTSKSSIAVTLHRARTQLRKYLKPFMEESV